MDRKILEGLKISKSNRLVHVATFESQHAILQAKRAALGAHIAKDGG
jgi:hypothetical protein